MRTARMRPLELALLRMAPACVSLLPRTGERLAPAPCAVEAAAVAPVTTAVFPVLRPWEAVRDRGVSEGCTALAAASAGPIVGCLAAG